MGGGVREGGESGQIGVQIADKLGYKSGQIRNKPDKFAMPQILRNETEMRSFTNAARKQGKTIGLVPTMGALHAGHIALVERARKECDVTVASIYVNPAQFAPHEDLDAYPRTWDADIEKLRGAGCDAVFAPTNAVMYPDGFDAAIRIGGVSAPLEGTFRPHFFQGVATVVAKLFNLCAPDVAYFGEKDYQQLQVVQKMVRDLNMDVRVQGCETVRDENGLALSSRNAYLSPAEYRNALAIIRTMREMKRRLAAGDGIAAIEADAQEALRASGFHKVDYATIVDARTLTAPDAATQARRILIAAHIGGARLIDNMAAD